MTISEVRKSRERGIPCILLQHSQTCQFLNIPVQWPIQRLETNKYTTNCSRGKTVAHSTKALEQRQWILSSASGGCLLLKIISAITITLPLSSITVVSLPILKSTERSKPHFQTLTASQAQSGLNQYQSAPVSGVALISLRNKSCNSLTDRILGRFY